MAKYEKYIAKFQAALNSIEQADHVSISAGNIKMGEIPSFSTLPIITCGECGKKCGELCYAAKIANFRSSVLKAYANNTWLAFFRPDLYWDGVRKACKMNRFIRAHVSGEIINRAYFVELVKTALENPHCKILCFTKRYYIVNDWIDVHGKLPANLKIIFSVWDEEIENPHNLPTARVIFKGQEVDPTWKVCGGNCFGCACQNCGCWELQEGESIYFHQH